MRERSSDDYYALLKVDRTATAADLRRSYRLLALRYHPDRAGPAGTELFQRIARAYAVLSDAASRKAYDRSGGSNSSTSIPRPAESPVASGHQAPERDGNGWRQRFSWRASTRAAPIADLMRRLSGPLEDLLARDIARRCDDGTVELWLTRAEAASGGTALVEASLPIPCPTCGGIAQRYVLWCRRCEYAGSIVDQVAFRLEIPAWVSDRTMFSFSADPSAPLRLRFRLRIR
jgi:molecular chaperone DnaJ